MANDAEKTVLLKELADTRLGYPFRGSIEEDPDGDVAVVNIKNAGPDTGVDWPALIKTKLAGRKAPDWLERGDVLFSARGARNIAVFLDDVPVKAVCAPQFFLLRTKQKEVLPGYLAWYINQAPAQRYIAQLNEGTGVKSVRRPLLESIPIPLPSLERQQLLVKLSNAVRREKQLHAKLVRNREMQLRLVADELMQ